MHLFCGLGNPGVGYAENRHNLGFMALDAIAEAHGFPPYARKFDGLWADGRLGGERVLLFKPMTFMNRSGGPLAEALRFYKIPPDNLIVLHDELDLPLGRLRMKRGGGAGGHNGIKSIDEILGAEYWRVRLGIGHPGDKSRVHDYVLSDFTPEEKPVAAEIIAAVAKHSPLLVQGDAPGFMSRVAMDCRAESA